MKRLTLLFAAVIFSLSSSQTQADLIIEFSDGSATGNVFTAAVGSVVTIDVFVTETGGNTELSSDGLRGFGLDASYGATSGVSAVVTANSVDSSFPFVNDDAFDNANLKLAGVTFGTPPQGTSIGLGQFSVSVSDLGVTEFSFGDYNPNPTTDDFVTPSGSKLDPILFAGGRTFDFSISAVPEPTTALMFGSAALGMLAPRRRKRNS
ncbi:PEP-CTERM sorting domain-containing protein [bacterium]|nr:PEP-CTERM sorting domain-containing protein [bacterium]MDC0265489.1 PEP-CTERM sorting domain-containing protein [Mariniblastus sp.]